MSETAFIVERLNDAPFNLNLTLVAFDEKNNFELLEIVNDIFTEMDNRHQVDLREESDEQRTFRFMEFLNLLKFPFFQDVDSFREGLMEGDRSVVYPILNWILSNFQVHKKRSYLARFLAPIQVPQEYLGDDALNEIYLHYRDLQEEFKKVHKQLDQLKSSNTTQPGDLRREISQLEEEKQQLGEKINGLKRKTQGEQGFNELLQATSALRKEQEEQSKLVERKRDQTICLQQAEKYVAENSTKLNATKQMMKEALSPEGMLERLKRQVEEKKEVLHHVLPNEMQQKVDKLREYEKVLKEPKKTENDVVDLEDEIQNMKQQIEKLNDQLVVAQKACNDDKLTMFRQHAALQAKKVLEKEETLEACLMEKAQLQKVLDENENLLNQLSGPKSMKKEDFKQFTEKLRLKTNQYKKMRKEMTDINSETSVLNRTEQILKGRDGDLNGLLKQLEEKRGVSGYMETQSKLNEISEINAKINETKGKTLEEISRIVSDINQTLKERKNSLAPQIKDLRAVRQRYQEMESEYLDKKSIYENTAVGLESERIKLEQECSAFQEDCIREESRYHSLNCQIGILQCHLEKVQMESNFEAGEGRLLRDFRTYKELYKNKIQQQESLSKELRKQRKDLEENASLHLQQKLMFEDLHKLLECKFKSLNQGYTEKMNDHMEASLAQYENVHGGTNVMTIEA